MHLTPDKFANLSPLKQALLAVEELQERLARSERERSEPIAIIGMGCRFPHAENPARYWEMLRRGEDAIETVPASRWNIDDFYDPDPDAPGKMSTRWGGFLDAVDQFDPEFFGDSGSSKETQPNSTKFCSTFASMPATPCRKGGL